VNPKEPHSIRLFCYFHFPIARSDTFHFSFPLYRLRSFDAKAVRQPEGENRNAEYFISDSISKITYRGALLQRFGFRQLFAIQRGANPARGGKREKSADQNRADRAEKFSGSAADAAGK
jgi:hypothetical protein